MEPQHAEGVLADCFEGAGGRPPVFKALSVDRYENFNVPGKSTSFGRGQSELGPS